MNRSHVSDIASRHAGRCSCVVGIVAALFPVVAAAQPPGPSGFNTSIFSAAGDTKTGFSITSFGDTKIGWAQSGSTTISSFQIGVSGTYGSPPNAWDMTSGTSFSIPTIGSIKNLQTLATVPVDTVNFFPYNGVQYLSLGTSGTGLPVLLNQFWNLILDPSPATFDINLPIYNFNSGTYQSTFGNTINTMTIVAPVPEPSTCAMALAGIACGALSLWRRRKRARRVAAMLSVVAVACVAVGGSTVHAATVTWFGPSQAANSNATWTGTTSAQNYGVAFVSGTASAYSMDWLQIGLNTSSMTTGSGSLVVELRNTTNLTPYSAVSGTTVYAADTITFTCPTTPATSFTVNLAPANFPNISSFSMSGTTGYSLKLWGPSGTFGILRTTGYANGTTNNFYTVSDGFVALDTFRNNIANYTNTTNSYPTLSIAFGTTAVPEPSTCVMALAGLACGGFSMWRRRKWA